MINWRIYLKRRVEFGFYWERGVAGIIATLRVESNEDEEEKVNKEFSGKFYCGLYEFFSFFYFLFLFFNLLV